MFLSVDHYKHLTFKIYNKLELSNISLRNYVKSIMYYIYNYNEYLKEELINKIVF